MINQEVNALSTKPSEYLKNEYVQLGIILVVAILAFKIAFYKDSFVNVLKLVLSFFWLFIIPGYCLMLYWKQDLELLERVFLGALLAGAVIGIASYYFGLAGLHIAYHAHMLPIILIGIGLFFGLRRKKESTDSTQ